VYLLPDLGADRDLAFLVRRCREVLREFPFLTPAGSAHGWKP
jgi:hypothetical protein